MTEEVVAADGVVGAEVEVLQDLDRSSEIDPGVVAGEVGFARLREICRVGAKVFALVGSVWEVRAPAPEVVPVVLVLVGVVVLKVAEHRFDVQVEPGSHVGIDRSRYIVFFYVVRIQLEDASVVAVAAGDVVVDLFASAGDAEVVLL